MWKRYVKIAAMMTFVGLFFALVYEQKSKVTRVLVVHSYKTDYDWVVQVNAGVDNVFEDRPDVQVRDHYMDLKNHTDDDFRRTAKALAFRIVEEWQPDVLILFDDVAQRLVGVPYAEMREGDAPVLDVVYGGVNADPALYYKDLPNVAGVLERKPLTAIRDTLIEIARAGDPGADPATTRPKVQFIGDLSLSLTVELESYEEFDWSPLNWMDPVQVETFEDWKAAVERAGQPQQADLILLTSYQQVRQSPGGPFVRPAGDIMRWTLANSKVPVLGMGWTNSQDGAMLTISASAFEQGQVAAQTALDIIDGASPAAIGAIDPNLFAVHICAPAMAESGLQLPSVFEAFARSTDNYYDEECRP